MTDRDPLLQALLGCEWGHKIGRLDDPPCPKDATRRVALHVHPEDVEGTVFKFCDEHLELVSANTEERAGPVVEGPSPELEVGIRLGEELLEMDPPAEVAEEVHEMLGALRALRDRDR